MLCKVLFVLVFLIGSVSVVNGQTSTRGDARAILVELGDSLREISESTQQCQALLRRIKAWQQRKLEELRAPETTCQSISGKIYSSLEWGGYGWLDINTLTDFIRGDRLRLRIGGTAAKILVRLLPNGIPPTSQQGLIGGAITVPNSRIVEIPLETNYRGIIQISVHGGPKPWNIPLGPNNGPATLEAAELCRHNR